MIKQAVIFLLFWASLATLLPAQSPDEVKTENGWNMAPWGHLHILVIFAELEFDSTYGKLEPLAPEGHYLWKRGDMPAWKDEIFSKDPGGKGMMTTYFDQASFGRFQVTGDYLDTLITVKVSTIRNRQGQVVTSESFASGYYRESVLKKVEALDTLDFAYGSSLDDFDHWTFSYPGLPKKDTANGKIDLVMVVWRNIHVVGLGNHSGYVQTGDFGPIRGKRSDMFSQFRTSDFIPRVIMRHEFSHMLYGGNNFHTANGGVGQRTFMSTVGGYSNMSASDACSPTWNAWDRERLGWRNPANNYILSARTSAGEEFNADLTYGQVLPDDQILVLRDFVTYGDAIRITLPHLPESVKRQYLWLENHQKLDGNVDHDGVLPAGLYAYISAGKDVKQGMSTFGGTNNYIWPLLGIGNYDFLCDKDSLVLMLENERENPFTGAHFHMRLLHDIDGNGKIRLTTDITPKTEYLLPKALVINGDTMPPSYFTYQTYPMFGSLEVPFTPLNHNRIDIGTNPAPVTLYTFEAPGGPKPTDNRRIYLNGISIEVLEMKEKGPITLRLRWDKFDLDRDVRWCGNIVLKERLVIQPRRELLLDQGFTVQLPDSVRSMDGEVVFAEPTVLELTEGSDTRLEQNARVVLRRGSTVVVRKGAKVHLAKNSRVIVEEGCYLLVEEGAEVTLERKARFEMRDGASVGVHPILAKQFTDLKPAQPMPRRR